MQNGKEAFLIILPVDCGQLLKMLITLDLHGIFFTKFAYESYFYILTFSRHWYAKQ